MTKPHNPRPSHDRAENIGEKDFRTIVFGQGVTPQGLRGLSPTLEQTPESRAIVDDLIEQIRGSEPTFFERFEREIVSGDVHRVDGMMLESSELLSNAVHERGLDRELESSNSPRYAAVALVLFAVAALVVGTVAVLMTAAVSTKVKMYGRNSAETNNNLSHEKWVAAVTTTFAN